MSLDGSVLHLKSGEALLNQHLQVLMEKEGLQLYRENNVNNKRHFHPGTLQQKESCQTSQRSIYIITATQCEETTLASLNA